MERTLLVSPEELEGIKEYFELEGKFLEKMFCEYEICVAELLNSGIQDGEVHDSLIVFLQNAEVLKDKFEQLTKMAAEQVVMLQTEIKECDEMMVW